MAQVSPSPPWRSTRRLTKGQNERACHSAIIKLALIADSKKPRSVCPSKGKETASSAIHCQEGSWPQVETERSEPGAGRVNAMTPCPIKGAYHLPPLQWHDRLINPLKKPKTHLLFRKLGNVIDCSKRLDLGVEMVHNGSETSNSILY